MPKHLFHFTVWLCIITLTACQTGTASPTRAPQSPAALSTPALATVTATATALPTLTPTTAPPASPTPSPTSRQPITTTLAFVGVIVPARCTQAALDEIGDPNHPYKEVQPILAGADISTGVFNAGMSEKAAKTGCTITFQLVSDPGNADALAWAGFDVMSVATNHIKDCGLMKGWCDASMLDTIANIRRVGLLPVGAGENLEQALQPVVVERNGVRFGFVSLGDSKMDEVVFATATHPGIAHLDEGNARQALALARQQADVVIALPHWGSEYNQVPNWLQRRQAQFLVEGGADLVVGNHTHVVQGMQMIEDVPVFYGLGNFVFDQDLRINRQSVILLVHFVGSRYVGYELIPTVGDRDGRVHLAEGEEAAAILQRIAESSAQLK